MDTKDDSHSFDFRNLTNLARLAKGLISVRSGLLAESMLMLMNSQGHRQLSYKPMSGLPKSPRMAYFVDSIGHVSGVSNTVKNWARIGVAKGVDIEIFNCSPDVQEFIGPSFTPVGRFEISSYPDFYMYVPDVSEVVSRFASGKYDIVHIAAPGPMGLLGLQAAKSFDIPVCGTYHTNFSMYAEAFGHDKSTTEAMRLYIKWFYGEMDSVACPSECVKSMLSSELGDGADLQVVGRGVDLSLFNPSKRRTQKTAKTTFLYVGRVSAEKNLEVMAKAFKTVVNTGALVEIVVVGEGPLRKGLERILDGYPAKFTGALRGDQLAIEYASADVFVFPSLTDTLGNVVIEAQASGLPVIVSSSGGPKECIVADQTGLVVNDMNEDSLAKAMLSMMADNRFLRMKQASRKNAETFTWDKSFDQFWSLHSRKLNGGSYETTKG
jgi:glycosyltransferase involved in cell wall biosynthesis